MNIDIPVVRQDEDSDDCGLAYLSMLFKYYGTEKSIEELKKDLQVYKDEGTYAPNWVNI